MSESSRPSTPFSRRDFLGRLAVLSAAGFGASSLLAACGGQEPAPAPGDAAAGGGVAAADCEGYDALTEQDLQMRRTLGYVDEAPDPDRVCTNCRFYDQPEGGSPCGGCQLFQGPVAPEGYCTSWAAPAA